MVFVTEHTPKGTDRSPQEYVHPLLVLSGQEYAHMTFDSLHTRLCDALRGDKSRVVATYLAPDGRIHILFEDGTSEEAEVKEGNSPN